MTTEIIEGNKLIETFKGERELAPSGKIFGIKRGSPKEYENWYNIVYVEDLKYHSSWDWLMPVVKKIGEMKVGNGDPNLYDEIDYALRPAIIENVWLAVIEFIQWYNKVDNVQECDATEADQG